MKVKWIADNRILPDQGLVKKDDLLVVNEELGNQLISQSLGKEIKEIKEVKEKKTKIVKDKGGK